MTDDTSAALKGALDQLQAFVDWDEYDVLGIDLDEARAILAHIADLEARAEKAEADVRTVQNAAKTLDAARQKIIGHYTRERQIDHVARTTLDSEREANAILTERVEALEARAKEAEAKVAAAEERGLVFNMLPDGRLDFCAIREGSRLWDGRVRAEVAEAREAELREAVTWLLNCHRGLNRHGHGVGGDGYWGNIDAATAFAREALDAAQAAPETPSEDLRAENEKLRGLLREAQNYLRFFSGQSRALSDVMENAPATKAGIAAWADNADRVRARIDAALARKMEGHDDIK